MRSIGRLLFLCTILTLVPGSPIFADQLPLLGHQIMIDPGHGGPDPGASRGDLVEEDIVLDLGLRLKAMLAASGAAVRLTRETDTDLADQYQGQEYPNRKQKDLVQRTHLANSWQPDVLISLHVNAIGSSRWRGAQVFYQTDSQASGELAKAVQRALSQVLGNTDRQAKPGDYRILNDSQPTAILVEVGFVSNPIEAGLLADPDYRQKVAWAILSGLQDWWNNPQPTSP